MRLDFLSATASKSAVNTKKKFLLDLLLAKIGVFFFFFDPT